MEIIEASRKEKIMIRTTQQQKEWKERNDVRNTAQIESRALNSWFN